MRIWAHTLVKNEAKWLWYSVNSIIGYVDKLLLWDTGSTDGSIEIEKELIKRFPSKISFKIRPQVSADDFTLVRQEMLEATQADWFIVADGDEIWWRDSMQKLVKEIRNGSYDSKVESIVVPTINVIGDIFHFQDSSAGRYRFGKRIGHYNLRAVNTKISGLCSQGVHGLWGWADGEGRMIQDRNSYKFVDAPYLHATNLQRSSMDKAVVKRSKKYRYEIGKQFPADFFFPEVFFEDRPEKIESPWRVMTAGYKLRAEFETPIRKMKRRVWIGRAGY